MKRMLSAAVLAALLAGGAAQAGSLAPAGRARLTQMNSPGDGLDGRTAVRQGNARPYRPGYGGRRFGPGRYYRRRYR